jgi:hypothetical protein
MHALPDSWTFVNHDLEKPTFSPSFRISSGHYTPGWKEGTECWCTYATKHPEAPAPFNCMVCHYILTDGILNFCSDCTHPLAGQAVPLPVLPKEYRDA